MSVAPTANTMYEYLFEMPEDSAPARPPEAGTVTTAELLSLAKPNVHRGEPVRLREFGSGAEGWLVGGLTLQGAWEGVTVVRLDSGRLAAYPPNQLQKIDEKPI